MNSFGGRGNTKESLDIADTWVEMAGERLLKLVLKEFGAIELMVSCLSSHPAIMEAGFSRTIQR
jgi:hypothetical protein